MLGALIVSVIVIIFSFICLILTGSPTIYPYSALKKKLGGHEDILKTLQEMSQYFINIDHRPIYKYSQIINRYPYQSSKNIKFNCHLGQRKLLLNEIQFYSCYVRDSKQPLVIYAGSASGEHTPIILKMFPNIKLLLIDPNYHNIDDKTTYIYQNIDVISKSNWDEFNRYVDKTGDKRQRHLHQGAKRLINMEFITGEKIDVLQSVRDKSKKIIDIKDKFIKTGYKQIIEKIMNSRDRVFIIQDYMTIDLSKLLQKSILSFGDLDMFFVTDIRTNMFAGHPTDLDIIWNSALQISYLKILKPKYSMLKFHPPYFDSKSKIQMDEFIKGSDTPILETIRNDLEYVKKEYKIDLLSDYEDRVFKYFDNGVIFLQPWGPESTSEARLIVSNKDIDKFIKYDPTEWEDKFYYLNHYRTYAFHGLLYNILRKYPENDYDGCFSCSIEIIILSNYLLRSGDISIDKITKSLDDPEFVNELFRLYKMINDITFYNLKYNNKCPGHGNLKNPPSDIHFYPVQMSRNKLTFEKFHITSDNIQSLGSTTANIKGNKIIYDNKQTIEISSNNSGTNPRSTDDFIKKTIKRAKRH